MFNILLINIIQQNKNTIQKESNRAVQPDSHFCVNWHVQNAAEKQKHYETKDGDMVRYILKPSIGTKGHELKWSSTQHKVVGNSTDNRYYIPSIAVEHRKSKMWLRHELMK